MAISNMLRGANYIWLIKVRLLTYYWQANSLLVMSLPSLCLPEYKGQDYTFLSSNSPQFPRSIFSALSYNSISIKETTERITCSFTSLCEQKEFTLWRPYFLLTCFPLNSENNTWTNGLIWVLEIYVYRQCTTIQSSWAAAVAGDWNSFSLIFLPSGLVVKVWKWNIWTGLLELSSWLFSPRNYCTRNLRYYSQEAL